ncbi:dihydrofolate reductase [Bacillus massilinigeriensis]|uniref:dihydrofolate reductase n=1 Tax=Bacillus mediterraneensis TaxID=1805474 RepID=UPI0008F805F2|nr:dihydrofolate reductase [Bacillus mediterraneensis]
MISLMWAMDDNGLIGKDNELPWHLPEDLKFFKKTTLGHAIAMGRKTHESIGKPLPGRENIIITRNKDYKSESCIVLHSVPALMEWAANKGEEVFVIGGAEIFKETLPYADKLVVTLIHENFEGDTFFPFVDLAEWEKDWQENGIKNDKNPYDYEFIIYRKKV